MCIHNRSAFAGINVSEVTVGVTCFSDINGFVCSKNPSGAHMCSDLWRLSSESLTQVGYEDHMTGGAAAWYQTWDLMTTIGRWLKVSRVL